MGQGQSGHNYAQFAEIMSKASPEKNDLFKQFNVERAQKMMGFLEEKVLKPNNMTHLNFFLMLTEWLQNPQEAPPKELLNVAPSLIMWATGEYVDKRQMAGVPSNVLLRLLAEFLKNKENSEMALKHLTKQIVDKSQQMLRKKRETEMGMKTRPADVKKRPRPEF